MSKRRRVSRWFAASRATWLVCVLAAAGANVAGGQQPLAEPTGPHPRLFSEPETLAAFTELARDRNSFVSRTVTRCREIGAEPARFATDGYMGLDWAQYLQSCLIAWRATGVERYGATALVYFRALLDDVKTVGDAKGGDDSAQRDSGYAIRALGPNAALAYDWLHDFPGVDEPLRSRARQRFRAWTDWYLENGYRARSPGTNYHAGYLFAATLIAVAQAGEAGADGTRLWNHAVDTIFRRDTLPAMRAGGVLVGGDWAEGWQYAPLSVVEYSLAARALERYGLESADVAPWLRETMMRHIHAMVPDAQSGVFVVGDTDGEEAYLAARTETLAAVIAGSAPLESRQWAESEMRRLHLYDDVKAFPLFPALAEAARVKPVDVPRSTLPLHYVAEGTGVLYARTGWSADATWFVVQCSRTRDVDHSHPNAGNFALSRGRDAVIVDPSPYGSLSSLTSNAPTVESSVLPATYVPSQAYWSERTGFRTLEQLPGGQIVVRCDYADQYRIQQTPSDIPFALRDFVLVPSAGEHDAHLLIVDRARTSGAERDMYLRFRTLAHLARNEAGATGPIGSTRVSIQTLALTSGTPELRRLERSSCFEDKYTRGNCDAARFAVDEYRMQLDGPRPEAIHLVSATGAAPPSASIIQQGALRTIALPADKPSTLVVLGREGGSLGLQQLPVTLVLLDLDASQRVEASAQPEGTGCRVSVPRGAAEDKAAGLLIVELGTDCRAKAQEKSTG